MADSLSCLIERDLAGLSPLQLMPHVRSAIAAVGDCDDPAVLSRAIVHAGDIIGRLRGSRVSNTDRNAAAELKLWSMWRLGGWLNDVNLRGGDHRSDDRRQSVTLASLGLKKKLSHQCRKMATIPEAAVTSALAQANRQGIRLSDAGFWRLIADWRNAATTRMSASPLIGVDQAHPLPRDANPANAVLDWTIDDHWIDGALIDELCELAARLSASIVTERDYKRLAARREDAMRHPERTSIVNWRPLALHDLTHQFVVAVNDFAGRVGWRQTTATNFRCRRDLRHLENLWGHARALAGLLDDGELCLEANTCGDQPPRWEGDPVRSVVVQVSAAELMEVVSEILGFDPRSEWPGETLADENDDAAAPEPSLTDRAIAKKRNFENSVLRFGDRWYNQTHAGRCSPDEPPNEGRGHHLLRVKRHNKGT